MMPAALRPAALLDVPMRLWHRLGRRRRTRSAAVLLPAPVALEVTDGGTLAPIDEGAPNGEPEMIDDEYGNDEMGAGGGDGEGDDMAGAAPLGHTLEEAFDRTLGPALDRTVEEIRRIRGHLAAEDGSTQRVLDRLNGLPEDVAALPEIGRDHGRVLGLIHEQTERTAAGIESLGAAIQEGQSRSEGLSGRRNELLEQQAEMLGALRHAIDETTAAATDSRETLTSLEHAADQLSTTTDRLASALQKASKSARSREMRMTEALEKTHRWTVMAVCVCGGIATLALIGIGLVLSR
jgi:hypothetical protein